VATPKGDEVARSPDAIRTYYGTPVLHEPIWKSDIGWYLFTGGLAGASSVLAAGAELAGARQVARTARLAALAGIGVSPVFLVHDLGRPARAANMLRVLRPTSPMSVGSWLLTAYGPLAGGAAVGELLDRLPRVGRVAGFAAAALGPAVATYTGVLVADTAIPAWHEARRLLPFLFAASAAASAGGVVSAVLPSEQAALGRRLGAMGAAGEVLIAERMVSSLGDVGRPYHEGLAGRFQQMAKILGISSAVLLSFGGKRRWATAMGGAAGVAGAACQRFAVLNAGRQSARDPNATVGPQRRRLQRTGRPTRLC
jgi:formate-dependent nitrite reductase membrane component NrfD